MSNSSVVLKPIFALLSQQGWTIDEENMTITYEERSEEVKLLFANVFSPEESIVLFHISLHTQFKNGDHAHRFLKCLQNQIKLMNRNVQLLWKSPEVVIIRWQKEMGSLFRNERSPKSEVDEIKGIWDRNAGLPMLIGLGLVVCRNLMDDKVLSQKLTPERIVDLCFCASEKWGGYHS